MVEATTYKNVTYVGHGNKGTLKVFDNQLTFTKPTTKTIYTLSWQKVQKRQVTRSDKSDRARIKLILKSGNEAIFQMDDRVALEVLRDDIAERVGRYKALYPDSDDEAINVTRSSATGATRRESTPYRMVNKHPKKVAPTTWRRQSTPYRMVNTNAANTKPAVSKEPRKPQPYRMVQKKEKAPTVKPQEARKPQPYRMVHKEKPIELRNNSTTYRYAKK